MEWYTNKIVWLGILEILTAVIAASTENLATWQSITLAGLGATTIVLKTLTKN